MHTKCHYIDDEDDDDRQLLASEPWETDLPAYKQFEQVYY